MENLKKGFQNFWRYRYLLQNLIGRDFKLKYRRSVLGVAWSVLNPLLMAFVMWFVFSSIFDTRGQGIENFPVYLLIGQLLFSFFREATSAAMESVQRNSSLLRKVYIPKYIFPLQKACFALVNCGFSFVALILVMIITGAPLRGTLLLCLYPLATLFLFCLGIGLFLSVVYVFFRDILHIWDVFCTALMYGSAIFYSAAQISGPMAVVIRFNPVYWYIESFRACVLYGTGLTSSMVLVCGVCALISMVIGSVTFKLNQDKFVLHM